MLDLQFEAVAIIHYRPRVISELINYKALIFYHLHA
jgi:hypothetical protein